jgi:BirA family biotin operon repressor/biotin-[acetyl-CoA-carboxylase] ligase
MSFDILPPFDRARAAGVPLTVVPSTGSTNADLLAAATDTGDLAVLATLGQTNGRGRLDRTWQAPAGQMLAMSVLVRTPLSDALRGWLPLVAGAAMRTAVQAVLPDARVVVKWPNDVLIGGAADDAPERKVCGILAQVAVDGSIVVGAGVNLTIPGPDLPTPSATSLLVEGAEDDAAGLADAVLTSFWTGLRDAVSALAAGGEAAAEVLTTTRAACATVGRRVRLELPDGALVLADAPGLDADGRLLVRGDDGVVSAVAVGDVTHLRHD